MLGVMLSTVWMDVIFTIGANISSKSTPFFYLKPCTTIHDLYLGGFPLSPYFNLYTHLFRSAFFPFDNSVNSYVWFSCKESISSYMACNHSLLWASFLASSKLSNFPHRLIIHIIFPKIFLGSYFWRGISYIEFRQPVPHHPLQPAPHLNGFWSAGYVLRLVVHFQLGGRMILSSPSLILQ